MLDARRHTRSLPPLLSLAPPLAGAALLLLTFSVPAVADDAAQPETAAQVKALNAQGVTDATAGRLDKALTDYNQALALDPKAAETYRHRGLLYAHQNKMDLALADIRHAVLLNPQDFKAEQSLGLVYAMSNQPVQAEAEFKKAVALYPPNIPKTNLGDIYYDLGVSCGVQADNSAALAAYTQAINCNPKNFIAYVNRGVVYNNLHDYDHAIADATSVITQVPSNDPLAAKAHCNRGFAILGKDNANNLKSDVPSAIADFDQSLAIDPKLAVAYADRGRAYLLLGHNDEAVADFTQALTLDPSSAENYFNRGVAYDAKADTALAAADYTHAVALNPKNGDAWLNLGAIANSQGKADEAIADGTHAIESYSASDPHLPLAYDNRGSAYLQKHQPDQAVADYTQAITLSPDVAQFYRNRAAAYREKGEAAKAAADDAVADKLGKPQPPQPKPVA